ncbi:hypothetical protein GCM10023321_28590 [Pseudonocardia eucalypti]|uniref:DUF3558 domain-containing protein n=1 Tax=Pseudonocardia eucalypti TaxID=648755 RepID=A0ABP9Q0U9_9PSEU|nr:hypothetical protein [Pseudonocardia eucalypti]
MIVPLLALLFALAGCAADRAPTAAPTSPAEASPAPADPALPPRPATLPLNDVEPCELLTPGQVTALGADGPGRRRPLGDDPNGGYGCVWSNPPDARFDDGWSAGKTLEHGVGYYLGRGARLTQVAGFAAATGPAAAGSPEGNCLLYLDVAPGQSLVVQYNTLSSDYPGMNHGKACQLATRAAEMMITSLQARAGNR